LQLVVKAGDGDPRYAQTIILIVFALTSAVKSVREPIAFRLPGARWLFQHPSALLKRTFAN
jgi:hypothetical protein